MKQYNPECQYRSHENERTQISDFKIYSLSNRFLGHISGRRVFNFESTKITDLMPLPMLPADHRTHLLND